MNKFVMGVSDLVEEECRTTMLIGHMHISYLMVDAPQIDESKLNKKNMEVKRERTDDGNFSNAKSEGQGRQRFKQRFSNQGSSSALRVNVDRVSNSKPQGGSSGGSYVTRSNCAKCGRIW